MVASGSSPKRRLVISIRVGAAYTQVSYAIIEPDGETRTFRVPWPSDQSGRCTETPSNITYHCDGNIAEYAQFSPEQVALSKDVHIAQNFTLHFPSEELHPLQNDYPLPHENDILCVLSQFLRYINSYSAIYLDKKHDGIAKACVDTTVYVFTNTHPAAGKILKVAALAAGFVPDTEAGRARLHLVRERDAIVHILCLQASLGPEIDGNPQDHLEKVSLVVLLREEGGFSAKLARGKESGSSSFTLSNKEQLLEGSLFIAQRARLYLHALLKDTPYSQHIGSILEQFIETSTSDFSSVRQKLHIKVAGNEQHDEELGIQYGHLVSQGREIADLFEPTLSAVVRTVRRQLDELDTSVEEVSSVILVGSLFRNEWFFTRVRDTLESIGLGCMRLSNSSSIADGALHYDLRHSSNPPARVAKYTYGVKVTTDYNPAHQQHAARLSSIQVGFDGVSRLPNYFDAILRKGCKATETLELRKSFIKRKKAPSSLGSIKLSLFRHRGDVDGQIPCWIDNTTSDGFETVCQLNVDTTQISDSLPPRGKKKARYYALNYDVVIRFGPGEFDAKIVARERDLRSISTAFKICDD